MLNSRNFFFQQIKRKLTLRGFFPAIQYVDMEGSLDQKGNRKGRPQNEAILDLSPIFNHS